MFLSELRLYHYRNLADNTLNLCPGINFVVGQNGQGKTNLLEAIHLLSTTRSFRTIKYQELIGWDQEEASVFGRIERTDFNLELGLSLEKKKRRVFVNGEEAKSYAHYLENFVSVSFTPSDLEIVQGGPPARRRFLDRYMCFVFPSVFEKLVSYQRALKNKNAHLKQKSVTVAQVQAWNEILIPLSYEISQVRKQFLSLIETKAARALSELAPQDGTLQLSLESNISEGEGRSEDEVRRKYEELIPREIASQRTLIGIHRDDVGIVVGNRKARSFASQGQTRSIVLALVLGVMELLEEKIGEPPVVLLDDVESELDDRRTQNLFQLAFSRGCQVFVSGTHYEHVKEWCKSDGQQIITVSNGKITTADTIFHAQNVCVNER